MNLEQEIKTFQLKATELAQINTEESLAYCKSELRKIQDCEDKITAIENEVNSIKINKNDRTPCNISVMEHYMSLLTMTDLLPLEDIQHIFSFIKGEVEKMYTDVVEEDSIEF